MVDYRCQHVDIFLNKELCTLENGTECMHSIQSSDLNKKNIKTNPRRSRKKFNFLLSFDTLFISAHSTVVKFIFPFSYTFFPLPPSKPISPILLNVLHFFIS